MTRRETEPYRHRDPRVDAALDWLLRLESGPDAATRRDFERWLQADPQNRDAFEQVRLTADSDLLRKASTIDAGKLARLDRSKGAGPAAAMRGQARRFGARTWLAAAAVLAVVAIGAAQFPGLLLRWQSDYVTATGDQRRISLPDGSVMTLNTASAAALDFNDGRRGVRLLAGEAFFDVVPDAAHPFIVSADLSHVRVTGTAFAVRTGSDLDTVTLQRGHVEVSRVADAADKAALDPGEMVEVTPDAVSPVRPVDPETALAWVGGRIVFRNAPLSAAVRDLGRYYAEPVFVLGSSIGNVRVSGNYRLADPEGAIRNLAEAAGARVSRLPGGVIILR